MRATVNSVDFYTSLNTSILNTDNWLGECTVQACDSFEDMSNSEAIEIEIKGFLKDEEVSIFTTLNYENALFLAKSVLSILEAQKRRANG